MTICMENGTMLSVLRNDRGIQRIEWLDVTLAAFTVTCANKKTR